MVSGFTLAWPASHVVSVFLLGPASVFLAAIERGSNRAGLGTKGIEELIIPRSLVLCGHASLAVFWFGFLDGFLDHLAKAA